MCPTNQPMIKYTNIVLHVNQTYNELCYRDLKKKKYIKELCKKNIVCKYVNTEVTGYNNSFYTDRIIEDLENNLSYIKLFLIKLWFILFNIYRESALSMYTHRFKIYIPLFLTFDHVFHLLQYL